MNPKYFGLNEAIGKLVKNPGDQSRIVAIAVALAVSAQAHLPSSDVENQLAYYGEQVHPFVCEKISEVGEAVVFASKSALDYAQLFWKMRYTAAFPNRMLVDNAYQIDRLIAAHASHSIDITSLWAGGLVQLSQEMSLFMNKYRAEIMGIASRVAVILQPPAADEADAPVAGTTVVG
jgi:hypothetical protein